MAAMSLPQRVNKIISGYGTIAHWRTLSFSLNCHFILIISWLQLCGIAISVLPLTLVLISIWTTILMNEQVRFQKKSSTTISARVHWLVVRSTFIPQFTNYSNFIWVVMQLNSADNPLFVQLIVQLESPKIVKALNYLDLVHCMTTSNHGTGNANFTNFSYELRVSVAFLVDPCFLT